MRIPSTPALQIATRGSLRFDLRREEGRLRARILGDLRVEDVAELEQLLTRISAERPTAVVIDLTHVDAVPCLAVSSVVEFSRGICRQGGTVQVIAPHGHAHEALGLEWSRPALAS